MDEELRDRIALFRYGVISPLVSRTLAPGEKERILAQIGEQEWEIPGTRRRCIGRSTARAWAAQYERDGFEGLKPLGRKDNGRCRGIPDALGVSRATLYRLIDGAPSVRKAAELGREEIAAAPSVAAAISKRPPPSLKSPCRVSSGAWVCSAS